MLNPTLYFSVSKPVFVAVSRQLAVRALDQLKLVEKHKALHKRKTMVLMAALFYRLVSP